MGGEAVGTRRQGDWRLVAAFSAVGALTQLLWLTYAPITTEVAHRFRVSESAVGWLANVFPLWYVILALPVGIALDRWFRRTVLVGALLATAGACVRLVADDYWMHLLAQNLIAISQPLILTAITSVAGRYLAERDRPTGIAVATASTFAGMIVAFVLGSALPFDALMRTDAVLALAAAAWLGVSLRREPIYAADAPAAGVAAFRATWRDPFVRRLCGLVFVPFGTFTALTTWAEPLLKPAGVTSDQVSVLLVVNIVCGVLGSAWLPVRAARRGKQVRVLACSLAVTIAACALLAAFPGYAVGIVSFAAIGALLLPALPIVLELTERESTEAEGTAAGLVWMSGQLGALIVTAVIGALVDEPLAAMSLLAITPLLAVPALAGLRPSL
jgi:predicted MFS family arabinose efflux permease